MITLLTEGAYKLIESKKNTKLLILNDSDVYAWINAENIGEILVTSHTHHETDSILSLGRYRLYNVEDEPELTDLKHLELHVGNGTWQGYFLPTGLPKGLKTKNRIIPTREIITKPMNI